MRKIITKAQKSKMVELYLNGEGSTTISQKFGINENSALRILKKAGVKIRPILRKKIQIENESEIVKMYRQGMSAPEIAEKFHVQHTMILRYLEKNGVDRRSAEKVHRIYSIQEDFFDVIDCQEKAYFLGFLYADGFNCKEANYVRIDLSRQDRDILVKLADLIFLNNSEQQIRDIARVKIINGIEKTFNFSYFNINSKHICSKLEELGCPQRKSLILTFPVCLTDSELQRHFIRGYYDGDGGVSITNMKKKSAHTRIVSTLEFCQSMSSIILTQTGIQFGKPYNDVKDKDVYSIHLAGNRQVAHFLDWLYKDSVINLDRKFSLYRKLLEKNKETDALILAGTQGYSRRYYQK